MGNISNFFRGIKTIYLKDLKIFFTTPLFLLTTGIVTFVMSVIFYSSTSRLLAIYSGKTMEISLHDTLFSQLFGLFNLILILVVPSLTMKLVAEEKRNRTFDLLWTSPVSAGQIVLAKLFAGLTVVAAFLLVISLYPIMTGLFADIAWPLLLCSLFGFFLVSACYVAIGLFSSSISSSLILSVIVGIILNLCLWFVSVGTEFVQDMPFLLRFFEHISVGTHFQNFMRGVLKLSSVVFMLSIVCFWAVLSEGVIKFSAMSLEVGKIAKKSIGIIVAVGLVVAVKSIIKAILKFEVPFNPWINLICLIAFIFVLIKERHFVKAFFSMKSSRKGLGVGLSSVFVFLILFAINSIFVMKDKTWDLTADKVNTLSEQSLKIVENLDERLSVVLVYNNSDQKKEIETQLKPFLDKYVSVSSNILYQSYNILKRPDLKKTYEVKGQQPVGLFLKYKNKVESIGNAISEESITNSIIKITRDKQKVIYYVKGHGELTNKSQFNVSNGPQIKSLVEQVSEWSLLQEELDLSKLSSVPGNASFIAIIAPRFAFLDAEVLALKEYLKRGGRLFLALDPLDKNDLNLEELYTYLGIKFQNEVLINPNPPPNYSEELIIGKIVNSKFDAFPENFVGANSVHNSVGHFEKITGNAENLTHEFFLQSMPSQVKASQSDQSIFNLGAYITGGANETKFEVVMLSDSDFLTDSLYSKAINPVLSIYPFVSLANDKDLIKIPPKQMTQTKIDVMSSVKQASFLGYIVLLPIFFIIWGVVVWFKRRIV